MKRVYHPTLDAWQDVEESAVESWKSAGWRVTRPDHVDLTDAPAVGEGVRPVDIVRDGDVSDAATTATTTSTT